MVRDAEGATAPLTGTAEHPFFVPAVGDYVALGDLAPGDVAPGDPLLADDGRSVSVVAVVAREATATIKNFEVADGHNYVF